MHDPVTLLIGLDPPESTELTARLPGPVVAVETLPRLQLEAGELLLLRAAWQSPLLVGRVVYHALFDFPADVATVSTLALWGGPCLPNPVGMLLARPRAANLAVARKASRFGRLPRSYLPGGGDFHAEASTVAKWGEWHCGEGKERFTGDRTFPEPTLLEPFVEGDAVRVQMIDTAAWQIALGGDDWKKSLHHPSAQLTPTDAELVTDVRAMLVAFGLELGAADYVIDPAGMPHLLEFNHIPNVTQFPELRASYLEFVIRWVQRTF